MTRTFHYRLLTAAVCFAAASCLFVASNVSAQGAGIAISPSVIEETLDPGAIKTYELEITNLTGADQEYFLTTRNIRDVDEGGVPVFADDWEETGFELASWIELETGAVTLAAGEERALTFVLNVPDNASPGSHFGGIFVSAKPPEIETSGATVGYQVANIVSIRVSGEVIETADIRQFSTSKFMYGTQDVDFNVRIENAGNVLVRPTGPLEIYNALGKRVGEVSFNESRAGVFPGDTREFANVNWLGDGVGFGRYEAILSPVYGEQGAIKTMSSTVTFWILPFGIIGPALGVLAAILLVTVIGVKVYIKRALAQATAGRRMVRRKQAGPSATLLVMVSVLIVLALFLLVMLVLFA